MTKVGNIIRLSVMNAMAADEFQKEQINLTLEKNKAFRDALRMAETALENKMKRLPPEEEEVKDAGISRENVKEDARPDHPEAEHELKEKAKKERKSPFQAFARKVSAPGERKKLEALRPQWRENTNWAGLLIAIGNEYAVGNNISARKRQKNVQALCQRPDMAKAIFILQRQGYLVTPSAT